MLRGTKTISKVLNRAGFSPYWTLRGTPATLKKLTIVMYHSVHPMPAPHSVSPEAFLRHITFIKENYALCALGEIERFLLDENDQERKVVITFDDAYTNFIESAFPILKRLNVPCTMFVPTGYIGGSNEWDAIYNAAPLRRVMGADQLRDLAKEGLVEFGSHTVDHVRLGSLPRKEMERQVVESKRRLEDVLGRSVVSFSYPYGQLGDYSVATTEILAAARYDRAVISRWSTLNSYRERMTLRRICFEEEDEDRDLRAKIEGENDWFAAKERVGNAFRTLSHVTRRLAKSRPEAPAQ